MKKISKALKLYANDILHSISSNIGNQGYTKFIILGRSRVGSNLLRGLINDHNKAIAYGEIFRKQGEVGWDMTYYRHNQINLFQEDEYLKQEPIDFLDDHIYKNYINDVVAVGFKLFYYHAKQEEWKKIWSYLKNENVKVIHLKRRNLLRVHLSRELAGRSGNWQNKKYNSAISLNPEKCAWDFKRTERWWKEYDDLFKENDLLEVWYEDLVRDRDVWVQNILSFLDVNDSHQNLQPTTKKQSQKKASELIKNYDSLKREFMGTKWEYLFEKEKI